MLKNVIMGIFKISVLLATTILSANCQSKVKSTNDSNALVKTEKASTNEVHVSQDLSNYETAYFASGCFWCVEAIFESVKGVKEVVSGYSGGTEENPTYEQVGRGNSSHAEAVEVYYDPKVISFTQLVQVFFGSHDPTSLNRQGPDRGPQYRSIAFYKNEQEKKVIDGYIQALTDQNVYNGAAITTQVVLFTKFWKGEEYHQDYEKKHPNNSYIRNVSVPRLNRFKKNFGDYLKESAH